VKHKSKTIRSWLECFRGRRHSLIRTWKMRRKEF